MYRRPLLPSVWRQVIPLDAVTSRRQIGDWASAGGPATGPVSPAIKTAMPAILRATECWSLELRKDLSEFGIGGFQFDSFFDRGDRSAAVSTALANRAELQVRLGAG